MEDLNSREGQRAEAARERGFRCPSCGGIFAMGRQSERACPFCATPCTIATCSVVSLAAQD